MQNFIVLGYIPGTDFQTTLTFWLVIYGVLLTWVLRWHIFAAQEQLRRCLHVLHIIYTITRSELGFVGL